MPQVLNDFIDWCGRADKAMPSTPKVSTSTHREAQKGFKDHFECDLSAAFSRVCIRHDDDVVSSLLTADHTCRQSEDETPEMTPYLPTFLKERKLLHSSGGPTLALS